MSEFIKYKLCGKKPISKECSASLIRFSQNFSDIDRYEVLVDVVQYLGIYRKTELLEDVLKMIPGSFLESDNRFIKLERLSGRLKYEDPSENELLIFEKVLSGEMAGAVLSSFRYHKKTNDALYLMVAAQVCSFNDNFFSDSDSISRVAVVKALSNVFSKNDEALNSYNWLEKTALNFSTLHCCKAILSMLRASARNIDGFGFWVRECGPYLLEINTVVDLSIKLSECHDTLCPVLGMKFPRVNVAISRLLKNNSFEVKSFNFDKVLDLFVEVHAGNFKKSLSLINEIKFCDFYRYVKARLSIIEVECLIEVGDVGGAISLVADLISDGGQFSKIISSEKLIGPATKWPDIRQYSDDISLSIVLDHSFKKKPSDLLASNRRTAVDTFLRRNGISKPSELQLNEGQFDTKMVVYFYRNLCVPAVIDMCRGLKGSRAIEEERREVLSKLAEMDPSRSDEYQEEILSISENLKIKDGLKVVDGSRIYVEVEGISRWAREELSESMSRYKNLVKAGVGVAKDLDEVLDDILSSGSQNKAYFEVPNSEADEILISMLFSLKDAFLFDKPNGLDSYLSKRVRHNSIAGYLRGPLENYNLITLKDGRGGYVENFYWEGKFIDFQLDDYEAALKVIEEFGVKFDDLTSFVKNNVLQIKTKNNEHGLIELVIPTPLFHIARSSLQAGGYKIDQWLDVCFSFFWASLEPSLARVRSALTGKYKERFVSLFDQLIEDLYNRIGRFHVPAELITSIHAARAEVQVLIDRAADWFNKREGDLNKFSFTLNEMIDIALESASIRHAGCNLQVCKDINPDLVLRSDSLSIIADIVLIVIGNISEHSGCRDDASLMIFSDLENDGQVLRLRFDSSVKQGSVTSEDLSLVEDMKKEILSGAYLDRVAGEVLSGLYKIASIVKADKFGAIDFGYGEGSTFFVDLNIAYRPDIISASPKVGMEVSNVNSIS
ncbi:hypothetical protein [uncultured Marinobacter sp.]|uniref:hypothetical protein n=1 Tax=uncultured Marinobacter sp. TaxID=187379 RepID=UPI002593D224|nr:hypothetical protein [uncultured Marinobacter sp.]